MRTPEHLRNPNYKRQYLGQAAPSERYRLPPTDRISFIENSVSVLAWPSRGGFIILWYATALDFEFLGFDAINPPMYRDPDQKCRGRGVPTPSPTRCQAVR